MNYLYHNINIKITIGEAIQFTKCKSIHISKGVQTLTWTARIELPREFKNAKDTGGDTIDIGGKSILNYINRNDSIKIEFGYDGDLVNEFEGYVSKIGAAIPLVIECENEMMQLKKLPRITKNIDSGRLIDILKVIIPSQYTIECNEDYRIGEWIIDKATPYEVLEELREKANVRAFFTDSKKLHIGMVVDFNAQTNHDFNFSENVRRSSSLNFVRKQENPLFVTVESKDSYGDTVSASHGDKGGNTTNITMPNLTKQEAETWAERIHKSRSFDGFEGTLDSWCYPRTEPGHVANITRPFYEDRHQDGRYFIESVDVYVNKSDGIKRSNKLSYKL
jgi:hypothetical protein